MQNEHEKLAAQHENLDRLLSLSQADTLFRDLYLQRARTFLQKEIPIDDYRNLKRSQTRLINLQNQIRNAMSDNDWNKVRDISKQYKLLSEQIEREKALEGFCRDIYESQDIPIDPFSPGMNNLPGGPRQHLAELQANARGHLEKLCHADKEWQDFYSGRIKAFDAVLTATGSHEVSALPSVSLLENEAANALENGNFDKLEKLAEDLLDVSKHSSGSVGDTKSQAASNADSVEDCLFEFKPETVEHARNFGLELHHVPSRHREFAPFLRFAWHPTFAQAQENHSGALRVPDLQLPEGTPDALKGRLQLFASHPLINSGGVRFLPTMVGEDVLVEDFPEPETGSTMPKSRLIEALGLPQRNQLSRLRIEAVLLEKGNDLLRNELGLDPVAFRLVCIPPDLHLRIGLDRGWGQQKIWTHFDGYMIMTDGKLWALAGGDIRYGGIYDLLGIARNYDSDRVIARFAVVQRRRMAIWQ
jgi:hypothetical protein